MKPIRVLITDDSAIFRMVLQGALEHDADIQVVGHAANGESALTQACSLRPDVVTIDIQMPGLTGLQTIEQIMRSCPVPIVVITSQPTRPEGSLVFEAIRRGALELVGKTTLSPGGAPAGQLRDLIRRISKVRVARNAPREKMREMPKVENKPLPSPRTEPSGPLPDKQGEVMVIGIGASAGGPAAIASLLAQLDHSLGAAFAVVQHLPNGFTHPFAEYLQRSTTLRVMIADRELRPEPGLVLVAPDNRHLVALPSRRFAPSTQEPVSGFRPSVDVLFSSMAQVFGKRGLGVILTGMGTDGAAGLAELRASGGTTVAQDEHTSAVYGMPQAAVKMGAAGQVLPIDEIGPFIARVVRGTGRPGRG